MARIVQASGIGPQDVVVEIGPGPGKLTRMLLQRAKKVVAIELDRRLYERLVEELASEERLQLHLGDALKFPYHQLGPFKVVANIPYQITTPLLFKLLGEPGLKGMTLTVQREVAERIISPPGSKRYGLLSVMVQLVAQPEIKFLIGRGAFRPPPRVDSACLHLGMLPSPRVEVPDRALFDRLVRAAFSQRRKTLLNALRGTFPRAEEALRAAGIEPSRRAETLCLEDFSRLAKALLTLQGSGRA